MLKRLFARLFGRAKTVSPAPALRTAPPAASAAAAVPTVAPVATPPPPPPPPPPAPAPVQAPPGASGAAETGPPPEPYPQGTPPAGHVRLILSDGTVVDPPVDEDFEERLRYLSENVLKRRDRPST